MISCVKSTTRSIVLGVCLVALASVSTAWLDQAIARWLHDTDPSRLQVAATVAELGDSLYWFIGLPIALAAFYVAKRPEAARWCLFAVASIATSGIAAGILKTACSRWRPPSWIHDGAFDGPIGMSVFEFATQHARVSFPSGHSTTMFALASVACLRWPRWSLAFIAIGVAVAGARVIQNTHWLSDVLAGAALGWFTPPLVMRVWASRWPTTCPLQPPGAAPTA